MADFLTSYKKVLGNEGGYSNHKNDRGKETYCGISRAKWPAWEGWQKIDWHKPRPLFPRTLPIDENLSRQVQHFYKENFWDVLRADEISLQEIADELFDTSVNTGHRAGVRFLQESLNVLNRRGTRWPDIQANGSMTKETLGCLEKCIQQKLNDVLLILMNGRQIDHYYELMLKDPSQEDFCVGWIRHRASI